MASAFQNNAFQNNAFQIEIVATNVVTHDGGGAGSLVGRRRRSGPRSAPYISYESYERKLLASKAAEEAANAVEQSIETAQPQKVMGEVGKLDALGFSLEREIAELQRRFEIETHAKQQNEAAIALLLLA